MATSLPLSFDAAATHTPSKARTAAAPVANMVVLFLGARVSLVKLFAHTRFVWRDHGLVMEEDENPLFQLANLAEARGDYSGACRVCIAAAAALVCCFLCLSGASLHALSVG
jgi:hypothetical protein